MGCSCSEAWQFRAIVIGNTGTAASGAQSGPVKIDMVSACFRITHFSGQLKLSTNNPMQEEAEEVLEANYDGDPLEIGFNIGYLINVLNAINGDQIEMVLSDSAGAVLFTDPSDDSARYVISPMVL